MLHTNACTCEWPTALWRSKPILTVPAPRKHCVMVRSSFIGSLDFVSQMCTGTVWMALVRSSMNGGKAKCNQQPFQISPFWLQKNTFHFVFYIFPFFSILYELVLCKYKWAKMIVKGFYKMRLCVLLLQDKRKRVMLSGGSLKVLWCSPALTLTDAAHCTPSCQLLLN